MKIIIVGCGKVGAALAEKLINENHDITVIDTNAEKVSKITEDLDIMGIVGNGSSISVLNEAGVESADVFIAVTASDELNLLCCMFAKKTGDCHAIARVRNPIYSRELGFIQKQLEISAIINPELASAREISNLLQCPIADKIDTFANGDVQLIKFKLEKNMGISGTAIKDLSPSIVKDVLICAVERDGSVIIPDGNFVLEEGDFVIILADKKNVQAFFSKLNLTVRPVKNALIAGGGTIGYYLAKFLTEKGVNVRIIEHKVDRCETLAELLPEATVILGDGTDHKLLMAEGLSNAEAFVSLTSIDEENVLISLFAKKHSNAKLVTKVNRLEFDDILESMDIGSVIYPKYITCDFILQHVRALENQSGSNIKTLYNILDDRVEALEFTVSQKSDVTDVPLYQLKTKKNLLICCIMRDNNIIIPRGNDSIQVGDNVIVVTLEHGLSDITDILS